MNESITIRELSIPSARGIVTVQNGRGEQFPLVVMEQWVRYTRQVLNAEKIDVWANAESISIMDSLWPLAQQLNCKLGLKTDATGCVPDLSAWKKNGLWDVRLTPKLLDDSRFLAWLEACTQHDIPIHLEYPFSSLDQARSLSSLLEQYPVVTLSLTLTSTVLISEADIKNLIELLDTIHDIPCTKYVYDIPLCVLPERYWPLLHNRRQDTLSNNGYIPTSDALCMSIRRKKISTGTKIVRMMLARHTLHKTPSDEILLPFLLRGGYRYLFQRLIRRMTQHWNVLCGLPKPQTLPYVEQALEDNFEIDPASTPKTCTECCMHRICDFGKTVQPTLLNLVKGNVVLDPMHYCSKQITYIDPIDQLRIDQRNPGRRILNDAHKILSHQQATQVLSSEDYAVEDSFSEATEAGVKWWSLTNSEKVSTALGEFCLPLTIEVEVGAGIADYMGFSFGGHINIMCPMVAYRHTLAIHINSSGEYVLLRDGKAVPPTHFEGQHYLPLHLGNLLQPRLSFWNIDDCILTQNLRIWTTPTENKIASNRVRYSIIVVCTQFARRLQAVLCNLAHQKHIDLDTIEVLVAYVPGLDATDDLLDQIALLYPALRIVRSPFPKDRLHAKGLMINESFKLASGDWIVLLDADILLPPDFFTRLNTVADSERFIAPDGRRLLTPETTASILLGETKPWDEWNTLVNDSGEFRHRETQGIPVGFCQCFKAEYLEKHPYIELEHFETADMEFGKYLLKECGEEYRLSGVPVLHLDHNGSQWYGTRKQM